MFGERFINIHKLVGEVFFYRCLLMIDQVGEVGELNHYELTELVGKVGKGFWFRY